MKIRTYLKNKNCPRKQQKKKKEKKKKKNDNDTYSVVAYWDYNEMKNKDTHTPYLSSFSGYFSYSFVQTLQH